jgi:hypothetical protein
VYSRRVLDRGLDALGVKTTLTSCGDLGNQEGYNG